MDETFIRESLLKVLPSLPQETVDAVVARVTKLGVSEPGDLSHITEGDLRTFLKPVHVRKLLKTWQSEEFQKNVFQLLETIRRDIKELSKKVDFNRRLLEGLSHNNTKQPEVLDAQIIEDVDVDDVLAFNLPITTDEELAALELRISDNAMAAKLISVLSRVGGDSYKVVTSNIMSKLFSREIAMKYSFLGRKGKLPFRQLRLSEVVIRAALQAQPTATESEVIKRISVYLATAFDRNGFRKFRGMDNVLQPVEYPQMCCKVVLE